MLQLVDAREDLSDLLQPAVNRHAEWLLRVPGWAAIVYCTVDLSSYIVQLSLVLYSPESRSI